MRKVALALSLVVCASMISAQSLTELAKKEKERRKANEKAGKESVVDVTEGKLPEDAKVSRTEEKPKKTRTTKADPKRAREDRRAAIRDVYEKYQAEELRCAADAARFGVERIDDLPSCREAKRLLYLVRDLNTQR